MTWHFCIGKQTKDGRVYYHCIEAYLDMEGKPWAWTLAQPSYADSVHEAVDALTMMLRDCCGRHPVLDLDAPMPGKGPEAEDDDD